jgi:hypothetical protein
VFELERGGDLALWKKGSCMGVSSRLRCAFVFKGKIEEER